MEELETKARELLDKLYADDNVDRNFESFCELLGPIIWTRAKHFINCMEGYYMAGSLTKETGYTKQCPGLL